MKYVIIFLVVVLAGIVGFFIYNDMELDLRPTQSSSNVLKDSTIFIYDREGNRVKKVIKIKKEGPSNILVQTNEGLKKAIANAKKDEIIGLNGTFETNGALVLEGAQNLILKGEGGASIQSPNAAAEVLHIKNCDNITITDLSLFHQNTKESFAGIIFIENSSNVTIKNNTIQGPGSSGIYANKDSKAIKIEGNRIFGFGNYGVEIHADNSAISNNLFYNNGNDALQDIKIRRGLNVKQADNNFMGLNYEDLIEQIERQISGNQLYGKSFEKPDLEITITGYFNTSGQLVKILADNKKKVMHIYKMNGKLKYITEFFKENQAQHNYWFKNDQLIKEIDIINENQKWVKDKVALQNKETQLKGEIDIIRSKLAEADVPS